MLRCPERVLEKGACAGQPGPISRLSLRTICLACCRSRWPQVGSARFATGHFLEAAFLFKLMVTSTELEVRAGCLNWLRRNWLRGRFPFNLTVA